MGGCASYAFEQVTDDFVVEVFDLLPLDALSNVLFLLSFERELENDDEFIITAFTRNDQIPR